MLSELNPIPLFVTCIFILSAYGFFYRCRGGFIALGTTQAARLFYWSLPVCGFFTHFGMEYAVYAFFASFVSLLIPHGFCQASNKLKDVLSMSGVGVARCLILLAPFIYQDWTYVGVALLGALQGLAYYIGWTYLHGLKSPIVLAGQNMAEDETSWAELMVGSSYGLIFIVMGILWP